MRVFVDRCLALPDFPGRDLIVVERSPLFQTAFLDANLAMGNLEAVDHAHFMALYRDAIRRWAGVLHVYLRCDPDLCAQRIRQRGRGSEAEISPEYLRALHERHEAIVLSDHPSRVLVLDCRPEDTPERIARAIASTILAAS